MSPDTQRMVNEYVPRVITKPSMRLAIKAALVDAAFGLTDQQKEVIMVSLMRQLIQTSHPVTPIDMVPKSDYLLLDAKYKTACNMLQIYTDRDEGAKK